MTIHFTTTSTCLRVSLQSTVMEALLLKLLRGNRDATALCLAVFDWANDYDHLIDDDTDPTDREETLHRAMGLLAMVQRNPFYREYMDELLTTLLNSVSAWRIATKLQRGADPKGHEIAHVLRWTPIAFFLHCARIVGGEDWVQAVGPKFWLDMTNAHSFEEFARECGGN